MQAGVPNKKATFIHTYRTQINMWSLSCLPQARWLKEELRRKREAGETTNQFRMYGQQGQQQQQQQQADRQQQAEHQQWQAQQQQQQARQQGYPPLPAGWQELQHEGHPYYQHSASGHTQWERPQQ